MNSNVMTLKSFKVAYLLSMVTFLAFSLHAPAVSAGARDGGGGVGVRCPGPNGTSTLETLDLHEASINGVKIKTVPQTIDEAKTLVVDLLAKHFWNPATITGAEYKANLMGIVAPVFHGQSFYNPETEREEKVKYVDWLPLSNDIGEYKIRNGCVLEQIAYYSDEYHLLKIVLNRWSELDPLNKAALVLHEFMYMLDRRDSLRLAGTTRPTIDGTSEMARAFVGQLFSVQGLPSHSAGLPIGGGSNAATYECTNKTEYRGAPVTLFYAVPNGSHSLLVFNAIQSRSGLYQMKVNINAPVEVFDKNSVAVVNAERPIIFSGAKTASHFSILFKKEAKGDMQIQLLDYTTGAGVEKGRAETVTCKRINL